MTEEEIQKRIDDEVKRVLQKLLDYGHGGGNWRRLIAQLMPK